MKDFSKVTYLTIDAASEDQRIDNFLFKILKHVPKTRIYRLLRKGEIRVNKKRTKPSYKLRLNDEVRLAPIHQDTAPEEAVPGKAIQECLLKCIIYEDDNLIVLNKPAGMAVHAGTSERVGLIEGLRAARSEEPFLELVHRLDKGTSGCLLIAKKRPILKELHEMLREGGVNKQYRALVHGVWPEHIRTISAPLRKNQVQSGERIVKVDPLGKPAVTHVCCLEKFASDYTLLEVSPKTGRTHQIRVHVAHHGHPIVGDKKYNRESEGGFNRLFLHAYSLEFVLPSSGKRFKVQAELDKDLQKFIDNLSNRYTEI